MGLRLMPATCRSLVLPAVRTPLVGQCVLVWRLLCGSDGQEAACHAGDPGSVPGSGRSLEKEMATDYSCLENSMDRGAWWAPVQGLQSPTP